MKARAITQCITVILAAWISQSTQAQLVTRARDNATFSTIQSAIDDAGTVSGDVLNVAAGNYYENVLVDKEVSIIGPKAGVDGNDPTRGTGEAVLYPPSVSYGDGTYNGGYLIRVTADNVIIDGLTLNGDNPSLEGSYYTNHGAFDIDFGIMSFWNPWYEIPADPDYVYDPADDLAGDNLKVKNNIIRNFKFNAILMASDHISNMTKSGEIIKNKIQNVPGHAVFLYQNYYVDVQSNTFESDLWAITTYLYFINKPISSTGKIKNNSFDLSEVITNWDGSHVNIMGTQMIFLYNGIEEAWEISGNTINNLATRSSGSQGVAISHCEGQALSIHDNTISNFENGYLLHSSVNFWTPGALPAAVSGGTVSNCTNGVTVINLEEWVGENPTDHYQVSGLTILNSTNAGVYAASQNINYDAGFGFITPTKVYVDVTNCKISGGPVGILNDGSLGNVTANNNDLSGNTQYAIKAKNKNINPVVNATCNWYGHWSGPAVENYPGGLGSAVLGNKVTFAPWLTDGTDNSADPGFQPLPGSCDNNCGNKSYNLKICHKGKDKCVAVKDAFDLLADGGILGSCIPAPITATSPLIPEERTNTELKISAAPNPFINSVTIKYELPFDCRVSLRVFDMTGKEVTLLVNTYKKAGVYTVQFDASRLSKGIYYYRLNAFSKEKDFTQSGKMLKQ